MKENNVNQKRKFNQKISDLIFNNIKNKMPTISETEQDAIDAGDTWIEASIFQGNIDWEYITKLEHDYLTQEEKDFIEKKVKPLLLKIDNTKIKELNDLPEEIWDYLKKERFFSMIIPKEYGGLEFSAKANSTIVAMLASVSSTLAVTVMVPNSLGPAELLMKYGTYSQKNDWLPKLAQGIDIPCFALTSPQAGSDAGAIEDRGVIVRKKVDGTEVLGIELNFEKRYITLAPIATVMGLAFKLYDPNQLIGNKEYLGITAALIPTNTKGIDTSNRHAPMGLSFMNGPIIGKNVFIPIENIIGGEENAGKGWRMLIECLSAGRGISLPALSGAINQNCARITSAYSAIREQFNSPIFQFEGISESLLKIISNNHIINATRNFTNKSLDLGRNPSVITAITKYHTTELARESLQESMDILAGKAIIQGDSNPLSDAYSGMPIAITVEGANILTRYLMIFGQGSMCCHPFLIDEVNAIHHNNEDIGKNEFNNLIFQHIEYSSRNSIYSFLNSLTFDNFSITPKSPYKSRMKKINHLSNALSSISDFTLLNMGGKLKYKEFLSSRLGDVLSYLFMATSIIHHNSEKSHKHKETLDLSLYSIDILLYKAGYALNEFFNNYPNKLIAILMRLINFPLGIHYKKPSFENHKYLVEQFIFNAALRENETKEVSADGKANPMRVFEEAYHSLLNINDKVDMSKINLFYKNNKDKVKNKTTDEKLKLLKEGNIITDEELKLLKAHYKKCLKIINVDSFKK